MKKLTLLLVPIVPVLVACSSGSTDEITLSPAPVDTYTKVIEDIANTPASTTMVQLPVNPLPSESVDYRSPIVVSPHYGDHVRSVCEERMSDEVKSISREHTIYEFSTEVIAIRWKFTERDWIIFISDATQKGKPRCRVWANDGYGKALEVW